MHSAQALGVDHLTALDVPPPELVAIAHRLGFDSVGLRAATVGESEERWPVSPGSPMLLETAKCLVDTGTGVLTVEVAALRPHSRPADYEPLLETGVRLGARFVNVLCDDPDLDRAADLFAALVERARRYELRPLIEPMAYKSLHTLDQARRLAVRSGGGGILLDTLHLHRMGVAPRDVAALEDGLIGYVQIADAPAARPITFTAPPRLPRAQAATGDPIQLESLTARQLPGDGQLPVRDYLDALPAGTPVNLEVPNLAHQHAVGTERFLWRAKDAGREVLGHRRRSA